MVLVIRGTGLRIAELLNLPLDCLRQRGKQWRLRFLSEKYQTEDEIPICPELVAVIQEQQQYIQFQFKNNYNSLFCSHEHRNNRKYVAAQRIMSTETFNRQLNFFLPNIIFVSMKVKSGILGRINLEEL